MYRQRGQSSGYRGLETLASANDHAVTSALKSRVASFVWGLPFESTTIHYMFEGFDDYVREFTETIDTADHADGDTYKAIRHGYQFAHLVGQILLGKPTQVKTTFPETESHGYLDVRNEISNRVTRYFQQAPTLKRITEDFVGYIDFSRRHPEEVMMVTGLAFELIDTVERAAAERQAEFAASRVVGHPDLPGF